MALGRAWQSGRGARQRAQRRRGPAGRSGGLAAVRRAFVAGAPTCADWRVGLPRTRQCVAYRLAVRGAGWDRGLDRGLQRSLLRPRKGRLTCTDPCTRVISGESGGRGPQGGAAQRCVRPACCRWVLCSCSARLLPPHHRQAPALNEPQACQPPPQPAHHLGSSFTGGALNISVALSAASLGVLRRSSEYVRAPAASRRAEVDQRLLGCCSQRAWDMAYQLVARKVLYSAPRLASSTKRRGRWELKGRRPQLSTQVAKRLSRLRRPGAAIGRAGPHTQGVGS